MTITGGNAGSDDGGGLDNFGTLTVSNSIFSSNSACDGGGIYNESGGTADGERQHLHQQLRQSAPAAAAASPTAGRRR